MTCSSKSHLAMQKSPIYRAGNAIIICSSSALKIKLKIHLEKKTKQQTTWDISHPSKAYQNFPHTKGKERPVTKLWTKNPSPKDTTQSFTKIFTSPFTYYSIIDKSRAILKISCIFINHFCKGPNGLLFHPILDFLLVLLVSSSSGHQTGIPPSILPAFTPLSSSGLPWMLSSAIFGGKHSTLSFSNLKEKPATNHN